MITIKKNGKTICINALIPKKNPEERIDYQCIYAPLSMQATAQKTLSIPLDCDEDIIFNSFKKETRYEIKRALRTDLPIVNFTETPTEDEITRFMTEYAAFAEDKNSDIMRSVVSDVHEMMYDYKNNDIILMSSIKTESSSEPLVWHVYLLDRDVMNARLACSISLFRNLDASKKSMIGRLNRLLHWEDILYLKKKGFVCYDLGGISSANEFVANIERFKREFCNREEIYYYASQIPQPFQQKQKKSVCTIFSKWFRKEKKKNVCLLYNDATFDLALYIVNKLSKYAIFDIFPTCPPPPLTKKYINRIDLTNINTEMFNERLFYKTTDNKQCIVLYDKDIKGIEYNSLRRIFNKYDVYCGKKYILEALACGCFVISSSPSDLLSDEICGIVENDIEEAQKIITSRIDEIRKNSQARSKLAYDLYSYAIWIEKNKQLFIGK